MPRLIVAWLNADSDIVLLVLLLVNGICEHLPLTVTLTLSLTLTLTRDIYNAYPNPDWRC